jgi:hypothetical protein
MITTIIKQPIVMKHTFFNKAQPKLQTLQNKIKLIENRKMDNLKKTFIFLKKTAEDDLSFFKDIKDDLINEWSDKNEESTSLSTEIVLDDDDLLQNESDDDIFVN